MELNEFKKSPISIRILKVLGLFFILLIFGVNFRVNWNNYKFNKDISNSITKIDMLIVECEFNGKDKTSYIISEDKELEIFTNLYRNSVNWEGTRYSYRTKDVNAKIKYFKAGRELYLDLSFNYDDYRIECDFRKNAYKNGWTNHYSIGKMQNIKELDKLKEHFSYIKGL